MQPLKRVNLNISAGVQEVLQDIFEGEKQEAERYI